MPVVADDRETAGWLITESRSRSGGVIAVRRHAVE